MITSYKRLRVNNMILWIQRGGNRLPAKKSIKNNLHFQRHTLRPFNSRLTRLWIRLISRDSTVKMVVALEEVHLTGQIWLVTSVAKRDIFRKTEGQREMTLVGTRPIIPQMSFQNGLLRSLLYQIPKIWQHPPWPATTRNKSSIPLLMMFRIYGYFTGTMAMGSGKISKSRIHLFVFQSFH